MTYKVVKSSWGGVKMDVLTGLSHEDALRFCEENGWVLDEGYVWDLSIEED